MSSRTVILTLAILTALMPFLGFPPSFEDIFYVIAGLVIAGIIYFSRNLYCNQCKTIIEHDLHVEIPEQPKQTDETISSVSIHTQ